MSKRHQSTRRRSYGRRLHELHELHARHERVERSGVDLDWNDRFEGLQVDPLAFLDPRTLRVRYGFGD